MSDELQGQINRLFSRVNKLEDAATRSIIADGPPDPSLGEKMRVKWGEQYDPQYLDLAKPEPEPSEGWEWKEKKLHDDFGQSIEIEPSIDDTNIIMRTEGMFMVIGMPAPELQHLVDILSARIKEMGDG